MLLFCHTVFCNGLHFLQTPCNLSGEKMEYFVCILLLAIGIVLVVKGGDWFVDAASWIAEASGIPTFIIGATIVSVATTLPEVLVSSISAASGSTGMAIGNAVGSVNCNIALIMGISLIFIPATFKRKDYIAKIFMLLGAIAVLWGLSTTGSLNVWKAVIILLVFIAFMIENVISAKRHSNLLSVDDIGSQEVEQKPLGNGILLDYANTKQSKLVHFKKSGMVVERKVVVKNIILFIVGAGAIVGGAQLMCTYGEKLAQLAGIPDAIIGVTILAVGTSLPELVTTITAIAKKKADLSVGNIIGANIIDIALILPICTFISEGKFGAPLLSNSQSLTLDFPFCFAVAGFALLPALVMGKFKRWQGILLLGGYITYITLLVLNTLGVIAIF